MLILRITSNSTTSKNSMHDKFIINNIIIKKSLYKLLVLRWMIMLSSNGWKINYVAT